MRVWEEALFEHLREKIEPLDNIESCRPSPEDILIAREVNQYHLTKETREVLEIIFKAPAEVLESVESLRSFLTNGKGMKHRDVRKAFKNIKGFLNAE